MGRDPNVVLADGPPWSGFGCVTAEIRQTFTTVGANAAARVTTNCPFATLAAGGGYGIDPTGINVSKTVRSGNGWQVVFKQHRLHQKRRGIGQLSHGGAGQRVGDHREQHGERRPAGSRRPPAQRARAGR